MFKRLEGGIASKGLEFDYLSFVEETAIGLDLVGTVFEKKDGSIKIIAEGEEENLAELASILEKNDFIVHPVENFYVKWENPTDEFKDFSIGPNE